MSSHHKPDSYQGDLDELRRAVKRIQENKAPYREIAEAVGVSYTAVRAFAIGETENPSQELVDRLASFVRGGHSALAGNRSAVADMLRAVADRLEEGDPIPWVAFTEPSEEVPKLRMNQASTSDEVEDGGRGGAGGDGRNE